MILLLLLLLDAAAAVLHKACGDGVSRPQPEQVSHEDGHGGSYERDVNWLGRGGKAQNEKRK